MDSFLLRSLVCLSLICTIFCKEYLKCYKCSSAIHPECADEFTGNDRLLVSCNETVGNDVATCRKEVNKVIADRPIIFTRGCYYSKGYPDDEIKTYQITYYTCSSPACNGMSKINSSILLLGFTAILSLIA